MKKLASVALIGWLGTTLLIFISPDCRADIGNHGAWGDQGDGTYKNPILPGDFSDPDVIRVGSDYYLITSTFQYSPGMAVMQSKDLVNWKYIGHCVDDLTQIGPELNWDRMNRYNRGIYAGALRYHDGKFWMFFTTMDEGVFLTTAKKWFNCESIWGRPRNDIDAASGPLDEAVESEPSRVPLTEDAFASAQERHHAVA